MTLDEAIKHAEEVAEKNEKRASWFWGKEGNPNYENCVECAEEHRQLAEWLTDYKRLLGAIQDIKAEIAEETECAYADFEQYKVDYLGVDPEYVEDELPYDDFRYGMERALEIICKHISGKEKE